MESSRRPKLQRKLESTLRLYSVGSPESESTRRSQHSSAPSVIGSGPARTLRGSGKQKGKSTAKAEEESPADVGRRKNSSHSPLTSQPAMTTAHIAQIVAKRKIVSGVVRDNTRPPKAERPHSDYVPPYELTIVWDLRFADMREKPVPLQFHARLETAISGAVLPKPGISLKWKGTRIRGVNWNIRHDNILDGQRVEPVRGWHEKLWNEIDGDKNIIDINDVIGNTDFRSVIRFCCQRWNIELSDTQYGIGDL